MKSKRRICFERFLYSDPGWEATVIPVAGSTNVAICMTFDNQYTGKRMYGRVLSEFCRKGTAEKLAKELNQCKNQLLATAYP